jgi:hypothetical protein
VTFLKEDSNRCSVFKKPFRAMGHGGVTPVIPVSGKAEAGESLSPGGQPKTDVGVYSLTV